MTLAQPIEAQLRSQSVGMIQDCQDRVFSPYRSRYPSNAATSSPPLDKSISTLAPDSSPAPSTDQVASNSLSEERLGERLEKPFHQSSYQTTQQSNLDSILLSDDKVSKNGEAMALQNSDMLVTSRLFDDEHFYISKQ